MKKAQNKGFGLLETVLATTIIMSVLGAVVALSVVAVQNSVVNKHKVQAYSFAQEGLEKLRQLRDSRWSTPLVDNGFDFTSDYSVDDGLVQIKGCGGVCTDSDPRMIGPFSLVNSGIVDDKTIKDIQGITFTREISVLNNGSDNPNTPPDVLNETENNTRKVIIKVSWDDYGQKHKVELYSLLTDWRIL